LADNHGGTLATPKTKDETKDVIAEKILTEDEWSNLLNTFKDTKDRCQMVSEVGKSIENQDNPLDVIEA
jgi:hypothetical protein